MFFYTPTPNEIRTRRRQLKKAYDGKWSMKRVETIINMPISLYLKRPIRFSTPDFNRKD